MKKAITKIIAIIIVAALIATLFGGCQTEAEKVSYNLSMQADNFNEVRQLTFINCITGDILFQMTGKMSITTDTVDEQLEIVVEDEYGNFKKHFIALSPVTTYTVEDITSGDVSKYKYTLNFNPNMWVPADIETVD